MSILSEAFTRLDLVEDAFDATDSGMEELKNFIDSDTDVSNIDVIDVDAESEDDLEDSYTGKIVIECPVCKSKLYKSEDDITIDDEVKLANVTEECPYCYTTGGFHIIGKIVPYTETDITVTKKDDETSDEDGDTVQDNLKREKDDDEEELTESFDNLHIDLDNTEIDVKEKTPDPGAETIAPLDMGEKMSIEAESAENTSEDEGGDETIDFDMEEIDDSADTMIESYLKESYDNVKSYKTIRPLLGEDKFILEGVIRFTDGTQQSTSFTFLPASGTQQGKVKFLGENLEVVPKKSAYMLEGFIKNKKLVCESLSYKYRAKDDATNKFKNVSGTVSARGGKRA